MKVYLQFYQKGVISNDLIPACGDRAVIRLDARQKSWRWHKIAQVEGIKRKYPAYSIIQGDHLLAAESKTGNIYKVAPARTAYSNSCGGFKRCET